MVFELGSVSLKKAIIHVLDSISDYPILSSVELDFEDEQIFQFISKHLEKILVSEELKPGILGENSTISPIFEAVFEDQSNFYEASRDIAFELFKIIKENPGIPAGDLLVCLFEMEGQEYMSLVKFNYKSSYVHEIQPAKNGDYITTLRRQDNILPNTKQRPEEGVIIHLAHKEVGILEKKYEINGTKDFYLSEMLLKSENKLSTKEKMTLLQNINENFVKTYHDQDVEEKAVLKKAAYEVVLEEGVLDVEKTIEKAFPEEGELKEIYKENLSRAGLMSTQIPLKEQTFSRVLSKQKIKTDTGVEITIPIEYYKDKDKLEFIPNEDGTISILIKNVGKIDA